MLLKVELNRVISEDEVIHAIKGLKNNKACGGDLIILNIWSVVLYCFLKPAYSSQRTL
jgi:hypothetical protein